MRHLTAVLLIATTLLGLSGCGGGSSSSNGGVAADEQPRETLRDTGIGSDVDVAVLRFRRGMAAACRRANRALGSGGEIRTLRARARVARRQEAAYVKLRGRLARLKAPALVRRLVRRYMHYVDNAAGLARQIALKADRQLERQVALLVREQRVNARQRGRVARTLHVGRC